MNSEELELSLRTEFEEHLKSVFAEMRQELTQLQEKVEAEFEKHKSQLSEVFRDFSARIETEKELDAGFSESVVEHLRLARDEGARITATAIAEAEDMQRAEAEAAAAEPKVGISDLRDAINDISSQTSQSAILKTLVSHAGKFTARGAFFIIKNEHFVGWRTFGGGREDGDDKTVREIFFPLSSETVLSESVRSLSAVESSYGTYSGDSAYLDKLEFGQPEKMFAVPLVARGRGVAVLYADRGEENEDVNVEALETLVRVAGLTVEVIASAQGGNAGQAAAPQTYSDSTAAQPQKEDKAENEYQGEEEPTEYQTEEKPVEAAAARDYLTEAAPADYKTAADYSDTSVKETAEPVTETNYHSPNDNFSFQSGYEASPQSFAADDFEVEVIQDDEESDTQEFQPVQMAPETQSAPEPVKSFDENYSWNAASDNFSAKAEDETESYQTPFEPSSAKDFSAPAANDYRLESNQLENNQYESRRDSGQSLDSPQIQFEETAAFDNSQFESPQFDNSQFEPVEAASHQSSDKFTPQTEDFSFAKEESAKEEGYDSFKTGERTNDFTAPVAEPVSQPTATPPARSRFSDRNVDLPIEVTEDERRLHNDARRFARLLVSEIKLYNEQKVKEGRESHDLYERLREAIDRSREMYDKRVQPPVAAKFDYFHYELVSTLAEGEQAKLGGSYQGANV